MENKRNESINFKTKYDVERDLICLELTLTKKLQELLKECSVLDETNTERGTYLNNGGEVVRYKIKRVVLEEGMKNAHFALFEKTLLDTGKTTFYIETTANLKRMIDSIKQVLPSVIKSYFEGIKEKEYTLNVEWVGP